MNYKIIISNLNFPEGPCFDSLGKFWCTEILSGNLVCYDNGEINRFHVGEKVNGAAIDGRDRIWFTDSERNLIGLFDPENDKIEIVCDKVDGKPLNRPNDLTFDHQGNLLVSCHGDGRIKPTGSLIVLDRQNRAKTIIEKKYFTNGIAFARDGRFFIYSETYNQQLWKVYWNDNKLSVIHEKPWAKTDGPIGPDGIAFDKSGNLYATVFDQSKIDVIDPNGKTTNVIKIPFKRPTSCAFDPSGNLGLVITEAEKGMVLSIDVKATGENVFNRNYETTERTF